MLDLGDALLFALSSHRELSWARFSRTFDELHTSLRPHQPTDDAEPLRHQRRRAASALDALGHCDVDFTSARVYAAPPVLAAIPSAGSPRAILCGARSPSTHFEVRSACAKHRGVELEEHSQAHAEVGAPTRIAFVGDSLRALRSVARSLEIAFSEVPPTWSLAPWAGSLRTFLEELNWGDQPEPNWPRRDFDPVALRFVDFYVDDVPLRLSSYENPTTHRLVHWLWRDTASAEADRSWGRYAALAAAGTNVLRYDTSTGEVAVPVTARLPRLLRRVLTLASGWTPGFQRTRGASVGDVLGWHIYRGVPPDVFETVAAKVGQDELGISSRQVAGEAV